MRRKGKKVITKDNEADKRVREREREREREKMKKTCITYDTTVSKWYTYLSTNQAHCHSNFRESSEKKRGFAVRHSIYIVLIRNGNVWYSLGIPATAPSIKKKKKKAAPEVPLKVNTIWVKHFFLQRLSTSFDLGVAFHW